MPTNLHAKRALSASLAAVRGARQTMSERQMLVINHAAARASSERGLPSSTGS
jgi:hypothetical protein